LDRFKNGVQKIEGQAVEIGDTLTTKQEHESVILVCTDVAARGLDIPNVQNVIHYQCPYNAEIYVHRCGRTARIGKSGQSLNCIAAEDEAPFKTICKVLKKSTEDVEMLDVKYTHLEMLRKVVRTAQELEKDSHREHTDDKTATWLLKTAKDAELTLDDDLKLEVNQKLSGKKRMAVERGDLDFDEAIKKGEKAPLNRNKEE
jgi:ATP-dependent RNA helicase DDX24/MAK5